MKKTIYYENLSSEVLNSSPKPVEVDESYKYHHTNIFYRFFQGFYYRFVIFPIAFVYTKFLKRVKYKNKQCLKKHKKDAAFIYSNHTNAMLDAFSPSIVFKTSKPYVVVNSANLNIPVLKNSTKMLGAVPIPTKTSGMKNFISHIDFLVSKKRKIFIYPEAHLWEYYTKIRPFSSVSFKYPAKSNTAVFVSTTTYQKTKNPNKCKTVIYLDGPFFADTTLPIKEQQEQLKNMVFETMCSRAKNSTFEKYEYKPKETIND